MLRISRNALALPLTFVMAACTPSWMDMTTDTAPAASSGSQASVRHNTAPKQALRITMTIKDAPGTFGWMRPIAHYDVVNRECLSPPNDNAGGRSAPTPTAPTDFVLQPIGDGVYSGVVYADLMKDEDYTGNGICRWELTSIVVQMKATGAASETLFTPGIPDETLAAGGGGTVYFNKISYPQMGDEQSVDFGEPDPTGYGPLIKAEDIFTVTFSVIKEN